MFCLNYNKVINNKLNNNHCNIQKCFYNTISYNIYCPHFRTLQWTEGTGQRTVLYTGPVSGGDKMEVARSPLIDGTEKQYIFEPTRKIIYAIKDGNLMKIDPQNRQSTKVSDDVSSISQGPQGYIVFSKNSGDIMKLDTQTETTSKIMKLDDPVDYFSTDVFSVDPSLIPTTVYITNRNTLSGYQPGTDEDATQIATGRSNYISDPERGYFYSVFYDSSIVKETPDGREKMTFVVTGMKKISDMKFDAENGVIYFSDSILGEIHAYDVKTGSTRLVYSSLDAPAQLGIDPKTG